MKGSTKYRKKAEIRSVGDFEIRGIKLINYEGDDADVSIPQGVKAIGKAAFFYNCFLVNLAVPEGVTKIGDSAFSMCLDLKSVTLPDSLVVIEECAFSMCESLEAIEIPPSVKRIGPMAFEKTKLTKVVIPKGCKTEKDSFPPECEVIRK
ncbi:MAG: leucine-rich repeat domain-containing protein [Candidatus Coproplasma sp.]